MRYYFNRKFSKNIMKGANVVFFFGEASYSCSGYLFTSQSCFGSFLIYT